MLHITASALIVAALSIGDAVCSPTHAHAHLHQRAHEQRDVDYSTIEWSKLNIDWASAYSAGQAAKTAAPVAPIIIPGSLAVAKVGKIDPKVSSASLAKASQTPAAEKSSGSSKGLLNGLVGVSNSRTEFGDLSTHIYEVGDNARNNVGQPYGANIIMVDSADGYDFTNNFVNPQSKPITVNVWNKDGPDGQLLSGGPLASKWTTLTFVLPPGGEQTIAVQENSNFAFAQATKKLLSSGQFDTSFGEVTFLKKGSGYNLSAIPNSAGNKYNMSITSAEAPHCTSDPTQNFWLTADQPIGKSDGSCFIYQSTAHLTTVMGGDM